MEKEKLTEYLLSDQQTLLYALAPAA